jgi:ectoine hydroxylase
MGMVFRTFIPKMENVMLRSAQIEEFESNGMIVVPQFLKASFVKSLSQVIDSLQGDAAYNKKGRWDMRNCLPHHPIFSDLMVKKSLLTTVMQVLGSWNIKILGSHVVKMKEGSKRKLLPVDWHRDGGALSAELPDPLPQMFIKAAFCASGSPEANGGELLVVPGSHRLVGELATDASTGQPFGSTRVMMNPGDMLIFDWRLWHAVSPNVSQVVRRMLYLTYGFRWLAPMDYKEMPQQLYKSPVHRQLLGHSTELGNYLPVEDDVPLHTLTAAERR